MSKTKYERIETVQDDPTVERYPNDGESLSEIVDKDSGCEVPDAGIKVGIMQASVTVLGFILLYFALSIGLTFYQRWLLKDFHFPLFVVTVHLIIKFILSGTIRLLYRLMTGKPRIQLDWRTSFKKIAPTGCASGIDIGFSNWGLELVTISLYTMTKSTTIIFILIFAILLGLEKKSWSLMMIVVMISGGLTLFTYKSTQFNALGFCFLLFASLSSGIRWSFAQLIMQKLKLGLHNPIDMIYHMQPWMILAIIPFTIGFEGRKLIEIYTNWIDVPPNEFIVLWSKILIGAALAFAMEISEFLVLSFTSSLTLSVAGIFKEICQLILAVQINGDQLLFMNILGLIMCLGGICCHIIHKYSTLIAPSKSYDANGISDFDGDSNMNIYDKSHQFNGLNNTILMQKHSKGGQNIPLLINNELNNSDSDDSLNDNQNASEVIFDVLKRRDNVR